jgi:hypothetical protein
MTLLLLRIFSSESGRSGECENEQKDQCDPFAEGKLSVIASRQGIAIEWNEWHKRE